jgi:hypothetical protein
MTDKANYTQTYWCSKGKYPELNEALQKLIPAEGPVANAKKNRALEKFRKASNCYYDLYNNGLCNRATQFRNVFGFGAARSELTQEIIDRTEDGINQIILLAAKEQGIAIPEEVAIQAEVDRLSATLASNHEKLTKVVSKPFVQLTGRDSNAFSIIGACSKALKRAGQEDKAKEFTTKAFNAASYEAILSLAMEYCYVA